MSIPDKQAADKQAAEELEYALEYGRCKVCDGIQCEDLDGYCKCCPKCGNSKALCTCCADCGEDAITCTCLVKYFSIWKCSVECIFCSTDSSLFGPKKWHPIGEPCPCCCSYCKELKGYCICCKKCGRTPCICCTRCRELRIKCKCWGAKILSHFIRCVVLYQNYQRERRQINFPANTAALIRVKPDVE
jgi:hypothetical protein